MRGESDRSSTIHSSIISSIVGVQQSFVVRFLPEQDWINNGLMHVHYVYPTARINMYRMYVEDNSRMNDGRDGQGD